jgi:predicted N-acyltransferase
MRVKLELREGLTGIKPAEWDTLVGDGSPFLEWAWLASLEESGCVAASTGWLPQHLTLWDDDLKGHSQGEFVFDHPWAAAAERGGIRYYPKLLVAVPFTPANGERFLVHPAMERRAVVPILVNALKDVCTRNAFSSVHVTFCLPEEAGVLGRLGFVPRSGYQFHWSNPGWSSFDDYLAAFRSKRRVQIKRERRELRTQGVELSVYAGEDIPDGLVDGMFRLYKATIDKFYWGRQYLNRDLFELLCTRWKRRLCFIVARRNGDLIAGTFNVRKGPVLYGRYWGALEELRYLHFNVCYYAAIEYCLREGIERFEPGAGGEFKYLRGFDASATRSMHFLADDRLARAVREYLVQEGHAVADEMAWLDERRPVKQNTQNARGNLGNGGGTR